MEKKVFYLRNWLICTHACKTNASKKKQKNIMLKELIELQIVSIDK